MRRHLVIPLVLAGALLPAAQPGASVYIATSPVGSTLAVDAKGNALVGWRQSGARQTVLVPARGQLFHGGSLAGPDVSRPAHLAGLPFLLALRRTPDGRLWALQGWPQTPGGPLDLHLARWDGAPTKLTLSFDGSSLSGRVEFHGQPVTGTSSTLEGKRLRIYVYLDCLGCPGAGWKRMLGVAPRADGSFTVLVRAEWRGRRYRASVIGPNVGTTFAPDAQAIAAGR
jgi:hypothetical protein